MHKQVIIRLPASARVVAERRGAPQGTLAIDPDGISWLAPDDYLILGVDESADELIVQLTLTPEEIELLEAFYRGEHLHYDENPRTWFLDPDGWGGPEAEIVWAVRHRGGLKAYGPACPLCAGRLASG